MISTQSKVIDGLTIEVSQLPGMRGLRMSARLGKLLGTPLAKAISSINIADLDKTDTSAIGAALVSIFENVTEDQLESITRELLAAATVDGKPMLAAFDLTFAGKIVTVYKVLWFALTVNYGSFLDVLAALGVHLKLQDKSLLSSLLTSK